LQTADSNDVWGATRAAEPEPRPGAGAQFERLRAEAGTVVICEVAPAPGPFLDTNDFAKLTES